MLMIVYIELLQKIQPYQTKEMNDLELKANIAAVSNSVWFSFAKFPLLIVRYVLRRPLLHQRRVTPRCFIDPLSYYPRTEFYFLGEMDKTDLQQVLHPSKDMDNETLLLQEV